jgi:hypothetical protein
MIALYVIIGILVGFMGGGFAGVLFSSMFGSVIMIIFDLDPFFVYGFMRVCTAIGAIVGVVLGVSIVLHP